MACSCATKNNASVPIFKSLLDKHCQVSSWSTFSGISLTNCPSIFFSHQFCLSSCAFCFLNSPLIAVSSVLIVELQQLHWWNFLQNWQQKNPNYSQPCIRQPWNHSKMVVLSRWSSYKIPLQNDHKQNLAIFARFLVFIPSVNVS